MCAMKRIVDTAAKQLNTVIKVAKPNLQTFVKYAKVELTPPKPTEIGQIGKEVANIIKTATSGRWKQITVKEAWLNALVATEVFCWFYVGECIGKFNLVGYKIKD
uniref:ATP synthase subunit g n=1 Tax=Lygus hesperus TaxID=30085 RepID=A0A0A9VU16_LYGHE